MSDIQLVYKLATSVASMSRVTTIQNGLHSAIMPYSSTSSLPPPSLSTLLCPHPSLSSHCPHLQPHTWLSRWSIYLSLFCRNQSMTIVAYLKILKLTIVRWFFYSTLSFSACYNGLKMFTYWSYFHTFRQQRIVEIAGTLHQLSGSCDRSGSGDGIKVSL